jgi:hypothetical protein
MMKAKSHEEALTLVQNLKNKEILASVSSTAKETEESAGDDTDVLKYDANYIVEYTAWYLKTARISIVPKWIKSLDTDNLNLNEIGYNT